MRSQVLHNQCFQSRSVNFLWTVQQPHGSYGAENTGIKKEEFRMLHYTPLCPFS